MFKFILSAILTAATASWLSVLPAVAHGHERTYHDGLVVTADDDEDFGNAADVVAVAEPSPQYVVTTNDTIVTPYGYRPIDANGYYQGYAYNPQYAYNPYYVAAAYSPVDPVSSAVVNTVMSAVQGNRIDSQSLIGLLAAGLLESQMGSQQYDGYYAQPQYVQPQYVQPQYVVPQYVQTQYVQPQYVPVRYVPVQVLPARYVRMRWHGKDGDHDDQGEDCC